MRPFAQKFLSVYSAVVSTMFLCFLLLGARKPQTSDLDELRIHRIDVVEPDGTLRMVISNKDRLPPVIIKGKEHPEMGEPRPQAGMQPRGRLCASHVAIARSRVICPS